MNGLRLLQLHYLRLPKDIKESHVMLMDATVATGAAAMMAIRVLLDHDVPQENIILLSMLMGDSGTLATRGVVMGVGVHYRVVLVQMFVAQSLVSGLTPKV